MPTTDHPPAESRLVVGISGASGVIFGIRLLEIAARLDGVETHLILSNAAKRTIDLETDWSVAKVEELADRSYRANDIAANVASGSFKASSMVVVPCSMKTLSGIANSFADTLLIRAADVALKDRRPLILVPRETPLHIGHLRLLVRVAEMGAVVMPPMPAFYHRPKTVEDIVDQTVNRIFDVLGIELGDDLFRRWEGPPPLS